MTSGARSNNFLELCREHKVRLTHQRVVIWEEISRMGGHPTVEEIFSAIKKRLPQISLDTVYRNLGFFEEIGFLSKVRGHDQMVARYEVNHDPHHHFCCEKCNRLFDLPWKEFDELKPPALDVVGKFSHSSATIYGICSKCHNQNQ